MGGVAVIIGLYIVLWGKAKDHKEVMEEDTTKLKHQIYNDQPILYSYDHVSDCRIDLEEPLLPENSANLGDIRD